MGKVFTSGETVSGGTSGAIGTIVGITFPEIRKNTGDILYIDRRVPIHRDIMQTEKIRILVQF